MFTYKHCWSLLSSQLSSGLSLVTPVHHVDLPAEEPVSEALVVDRVWRVPVRGPLEDAGLPCNIDQTSHDVVAIAIAVAVACISPSWQKRLRDLW